MTHKLPYKSQLIVALLWTLTNSLYVGMLYSPLYVQVSFHEKLILLQFQHNSCLYCLLVTGPDLVIADVCLLVIGMDSS